MFPIFQLEYDEEKATKSANKGILTVVLDEP